MDKKIWSKITLNLSLDYCFGMATTCANGTVFIFGGSNHSRYADASINILWSADERSDPWEALAGS